MWHLSGLPSVMFLHSSDLQATEAADRKLRSLKGKINLSSFNLVFLLKYLSQQQKSKYHTGAFEVLKKMYLPLCSVQCSLTFVRSTESRGLYPFIIACLPGCS